MICINSLQNYDCVKFKKLITSLSTGTYFVSTSTFLQKSTGMHDLKEWWRKEEHDYTAQKQRHNIEYFGKTSKQIKIRIEMNWEIRTCTNYHDDKVSIALFWIIL